MVRYYRGFCQNFAIIVTTLIDLLSLKNPFIWTNVAQQAFEAAKALLATAPVLAAPRFEDPFCLAVDASDFGMGSVLLQVGSNGVEAFAPLSCQCNTLRSIWTPHLVPLLSIRIIILWSSLTG